MLPLSFALAFALLASVGCPVFADDAARGDGDLSQVAVWASSPTLPNETVLLRFANDAGGGVAATATLQLCDAPNTSLSLRDHTLVNGNVAGSSSGNSNEPAMCEAVQLQLGWDEGAAFAVPASRALDVWSVYANATTGSSAAATTTGNPSEDGLIELARVNEADAWWVTCFVESTASNSSSTDVGAVSYTHLTLPTKRIV